MAYKYDPVREGGIDDVAEMTCGERFVKIWDFMLGYFHLEKTELLVYAIIFAMYRNYCDYFTGSREYLERWTNASKRTVAEALKSLEEKNLIKKRYRQYDNIKKAIYIINTEALPTCEFFSLENRNARNNEKIRQARKK